MNEAVELPPDISDREMLFIIDLHRSSLFVAPNFPDPPLNTVLSRDKKFPQADRGKMVKLGYLWILRTLRGRLNVQTPPRLIHIRFVPPFVFGEPLEVSYQRTHHRSGWEYKQQHTDVIT